MSKEKISKEQQSVNFWLDMRAEVENLLNFGGPEKHLEILEMVHDAFIQSEWANDQEDRRNAHVEYGILRDILKTMQKHNMTAPVFLPELPV